MSATGRMFHEQQEDKDALICELAETLRNAQEELRLIREKDCDVVYDSTLRTRIDIVLAKVTP